MKAKEPIHIVAFVVSRFALDGGAMFGVVPKPLWERKFPPDSKNRISMVTRVLVLQFPDAQRNIVVDAGLGRCWTPGETERFDIDLNTASLSDCLQSVGIRPSQVTDGICTHLHFDHAGGWTERDESEQFKPLFLSARHYVHRDQWRAACRPSLRDRASFKKPHFLPIEQAGLIEMNSGDPLRQFGIELICLNGHTPGLQIPIIHGQEETVAFPSDLIPTSAHVNPPWIMAYDAHPMATLTEKTRLLERAAANHWILVLEHDPEVAAVRITRDGDRFDWRPCTLPDTI